MDVDAVADQLYGLPLEQFTAARTAFVKQARQAGERDAAASIQALGKPSASAGLVNQLVRHHREELAPLLALGAGLRAAMASLSGPELRTLGRQQHRLIAALVEQARSLAAATGATVSPDTARGLEETLHAALADEQAADELMAGRLTETLHRSGLGVTGETIPLIGAPTARPARIGGSTVPRVGSSGRRGAAPGGRRTPARPAEPVERGQAEPAQRGRAEHSAADAERAERAAADAERAEAERTAAEAERTAAEADLKRAGRDLIQAETQAAQAQAELDQVRDTVSRLRTELDRATSEQQRVGRVQRRLRTQTERARRAQVAAQHRLDALE